MDTHVCFKYVSAELSRVLAAFALGNGARNLKFARTELVCAYLPMREISFMDVSIWHPNVTAISRVLTQFQFKKSICRKLYFVMWNFIRETAKAWRILTWTRIFLFRVFQILSVWLPVHFSEWLDVLDDGQRSWSHATSPLWPKTLFLSRGSAKKAIDQNTSSTITYFTIVDTLIVGNPFVYKLFKNSWNQRQVVIIYVIPHDAFVKCAFSVFACVGYWSNWYSLLII